MTDGPPVPLQPPGAPGGLPWLTNLNVGLDIFFKAQGRLGAEKS